MPHRSSAYNKELDEWGIRLRKLSPPANETFWAFHDGRAPTVLDGVTSCQAVHRACGRWHLEGWKGSRVRSEVKHVFGKVRGPSIQKSISAR